MAPAQLLERVRGEVGAIALALDWLNAKCGVAGNRQLHHLDALIEARQVLALLVRRDVCRHKPDLVEAPLLAALLGEDQMAQVDGVERPAKDANATQICRFASFHAASSSS